MIKLSMVSKSPINCFMDMTILRMFQFADAMKNILQEHPTE